MRAREGAWKQADGAWEARAWKFRRVEARDRRSSNFERRVRAREVSDGDKASTDV